MLSVHWVGWTMKLSSSSIILSITFSISSTCRIVRVIDFYISFCSLLLTCWSIYPAVMMCWHAKGEAFSRWSRLPLLEAIKSNQIYITTEIPMLYMIYWVIASCQWSVHSRLIVLGCWMWMKISILAPSLVMSNVNWNSHSNVEAIFVLHFLWECILPCLTPASVWWMTKHGYE